MQSTHFRVCRLSKKRHPTSDFSNLDEASSAKGVVEDE